MARQYPIRGSQGLLVVSRRRPSGSSIIVPEVFVPMFRSNLSGESTVECKERPLLVDDERSWRFRVIYIVLIIFHMAFQVGVVGAPQEGTSAASKPAVIPPEASVENILEAVDRHSESLKDFSARMKALQACPVVRSSRSNHQSLDKEVAKHSEAFEMGPAKEDEA